MLTLSSKLQRPIVVCGLLSAIMLFQGCGQREAASLKNDAATRASFAGPTRASQIPKKWQAFAESMYEKNNPGKKMPQ
jgi:hypothetical protein